MKHLPASRTLQSGVRNNLLRLNSAASQARGNDESGDNWPLVAQVVEQLIRENEIGVGTLPRRLSVSRIANTVSGSVTVSVDHIY